MKDPLIEDKNLKVILSDGEMSKLMLQKDWARTTLGPIHTWPQRLRTALSIIFHSGYPMFVWWGPDRIMFHNDAYLPVLGNKHPKALGKRAEDEWAEIWNDIGPIIDYVYKGEQFYAQDLLLFLERKGFPEETYWTFSYSPIINDKGEVEGLFCACNEETEKILRERRLKTLKDISALSAVHKNIDELSVAAVKVVDENPNDSPYSGLYRMEKDFERATLIFGSKTDKGTFVLPQVISAQEHASVLSTMSSAIQNGQIEIVDGIQGFVISTKMEGEHNFAIIPLHKTEREEPDRVLVCGISSNLEFNAEYNSYLNLVAAQISTAIADVKSFEEERKRVKALEEIDRAKNVFFSNVSHEFRTPLTLIRNPIEDLLINSPEKIDTQSLPEILRMVHRNTLRLQKLVNTLLDFSRIEAGRIQAVYVPTDIGKYTADLASSFRSATDKAGLELVLQIEKVDQPIYLDHNMWEKIVLNLISNAFKFTLEGKITVKVLDEKKQVALLIQDTGTGITAEQLPHIFDRFHRIEGAKARTQEGSGIGLALVQELVKLHGGTINVESVFGKGTTFTVTLLKGKDHLDPNSIGNSDQEQTYLNYSQAYIEEALRWVPNNGDESNTREIGTFDLPAEKPSMDRSTQAPTILIADDNLDMQEYLKSLLRTRYKVITVNNGKEVLELLENGQQPDLIISDVMMPEMDGFDLIQAIKPQEDFAHIPVILLSARAGEEAKVEGLLKGADDYITKPFSARELLARVETRLEIAPLRAKVQMEERNRLQYLADLFKQSPAAIAVVEGPEYIFTLANPLYQKLINRNEEQLIGRPVRKVFPEVEGQGIFELLDGVYQSGEAFVATEFPAQFDRANNGQLELAYFNFVAQPIKGESKKVHSIMIHAFEVTMQIMTNEKIKAKEEEQRFLSDATKLLNTTLDHEKLLKSFAEIAVPRISDFCFFDIFTEQQDIKRITWSHSDQEKQKFFDQVFHFTPPYQHDNHPIHQALATGKPVFISKVTDEWLKEMTTHEAHFKFMKDLSFHSWLTIPLIFRQKKLGALTFGLSQEKRKFSPSDIHMAEELASRVALAIHNANLFDQAQKEIAERKLLEQQKDDFMRIAGHELRTPMTSLIGYLGLLIRMQKEEGPAKEFLNKALQSTIKMKSLISDFLDLSKAQRGQLTFEIAPFDFDKMVTETVEQIQLSYPGYQIHLNGETGKIIKGDRDRLEQVIFNLLNNAIKYSPGMYNIEVGIEAKEDMIRLKVRDYGIGIDENEINNIFTKFYRSDYSTKIKGMGLGLYIVKEIVDYHKGSIIVKDMNGKGTKFIVELPVNR